MVELEKLREKANNYGILAEAEKLIKKLEEKSENGEIQEYIPLIVGIVDKKGKQNTQKAVSANITPAIRKHAIILLYTTTITLIGALVLSVVGVHVWKEADMFKYMLFGSFVAIVALNGVLYKFLFTRRLDEGDTLNKLKKALEVTKLIDKFNA